MDGPAVQSRDLRNPLRAYPQPIRNRSARAAFSQQCKNLRRTLRHRLKPPLPPTRQTQGPRTIENVVLSQAEPLGDLANGGARLPASRDGKVMPPAKALANAHGHNARDLTSGPGPVTCIVAPRARRVERKIGRGQKPADQYDGSLRESPGRGQPSSGPLRFWASKAPRRSRSIPTWASR